MATPTVILKSLPGIKRDGTRFDGDFYTDGQWVRFQRGLPRKIGGYRSINRFLSEISRGFTSFTQANSQYCHSAGSSTVQRFIIDPTRNSSIISDRTPMGVSATGLVTLTGGSTGSVDQVKVNDVIITSGSTPFTTDLNTTAAALAADITSFNSFPKYNATSLGPIVTITAPTVGQSFNGFVVLATTTTITATTSNMAFGLNALAVSDDNRWMFNYEFDSSTTDNLLLAHVAPNGACSCNDVGGQIFYGSVVGTEALQEIVLPPGANATGGIVALHPYLFYYGTAGIIGWSIPGGPTDLSGAGSGIARVWGQKIIKGMPLRAGAGSAPAGLFWAYDAVIRCSFTGGSTVFQFDVIASDTSIMSADCVVDYDGVFFWAGVDRFLMFNGVVREVPNAMNLNWFFDNLNESQRSKVFAFKVTRYGEIWWAYPRGDATECTHAIIYNVRENSWYDTELPSSGRSAGGFNNAFAAPLLVGAEPVNSGYQVWIHEQGVDQVDGTGVSPIQSYFETADLSALVQGKDSRLRLTLIEPDFVQSGPMSVQVTGRANARAPDVYSQQFMFPESATTPAEQIVMMKEMRRELRVKFESNSIGGDYQMGQIIGHVDNGDGTRLG